MKQWKLYILALAIAACRQRAPNAAGPARQSYPQAAGVYYAKNSWPFDPATFIPELVADTGFHFVSGMQYGNQYQHTYYYCIYRMHQQRVLNILNGLRMPSVIQHNGDTIYSRCEKMDTAAFMRNLVSPSELHITPQNYFYGVKRMKNYEVYSFFKGLMMHHMIFPQNSPLVYHRIIWLTY